MGAGLVHASAIARWSPGLETRLPSSCRAQSQALPGTWQVLTQLQNQALDQDRGGFLMSQRPSPEVLTRDAQSAQTSVSCHMDDCSLLEFPFVFMTQASTVCIMVILYPGCLMGPWINLWRN